MFKLLQRIRRYFTAAGNMKFTELADPKIQLEQAIGEAQDQHRRLTEQAASVIANQKQTEMRLSRAMEDLEKVNASARQAVLMADEATKSDNTGKAAEYTRAAEAFAGRLVSIEKEVESLKMLSLQSTEASDKAKAAVQQNSTALQAKLNEKQKLLSQLDQAKMQEQMNKAMAQLTASVGQDVPTLAEVRDKIEARYAKAIGHAELQSTTVETRMLEVEQAAHDTEAVARLDKIRSQLGLETPKKAEESAPATPAAAEQQPEA
ncbi:MAG: PspA/IM30 family protein [Actinobacteria bacterium]|nr:PspA/IM30 family protein [Actinomycetota bacterium]